MEDRFRQAITDKYGQQKKHLLPREEYNQTIEDIKTAKNDQKVVCNIIFSLGMYIFIALIIQLFIKKNYLKEKIQ